MAGQLPVYTVSAFGEHEPDFYANTFSNHVKHHHFITVPHKHDFYLVVLFTKGSGKHEIDFTTHTIKPGRVFFLSPGQAHNWVFSEDAEGYVFFHSRQFYELAFNAKKLSDFPFYASLQNPPFLDVKPAALNEIKSMFKRILDEYRQQQSLRVEKLRSLVDVCCIDLARQYPVKGKIRGSEHSYLEKFHRFEALLDQHFATVKSPGAYAEKMSMSEKHLNRICKTCVNKTTGELIAGRLVLEAKRLFIRPGITVGLAAEELGFDDTAYFSRFFRKQTGLTPRDFMRKYAVD